MDGNLAGVPDFVVFDPTVFDPGSTHTISLTSGELSVSDHLQITGPGTDVVTVERDSGASDFRIFSVASDIESVV